MAGVLGKERGSWDGASFCEVSPAYFLALVVCGLAVLLTPVLLVAFGFVAAAATGLLTFLVAAGVVPRTLRAANRPAATAAKVTGIHNQALLEFLAVLPVLCASDLPSEFSDFLVWAAATS